MTIIRACVPQNSHGGELVCATLVQQDNVKPRIGCRAGKGLHANPNSNPLCDKRTVQLDTNTVQHSQSTGLDACVVLEANCSSPEPLVLLVVEGESQKGARGLALTM